MLSLMENTPVPQILKRAFIFQYGYAFPYIPIQEQVLSLSLSLTCFLKFKYLKLPERQKKIVLFKNSFAAAKWDEVKSSLNLV